MESAANFYHKYFGPKLSTIPKHKFMMKMIARISAYCILIKILLTRKVMPFQVLEEINIIQPNCY